MISRSQALKLVQKWQKKLNLMHWTFGISTQAPEQACHMEIAITPIRQHGAIRISETGWNLSRAEFEIDVIHELLHAVFEPIYLEHARSCRKADEVFMEKTVETAVDHLAKALYNVNARVV